MPKIDWTLKYAKRLYQMWRIEKCGMIRTIGFHHESNTMVVEFQTGKIIYFAGILYSEFRTIAESDEPYLEYRNIMVERTKRKQTPYTICLQPPHGLYSNEEQYRAIMSGPRSPHPYEPKPPNPIAADPNLFMEELEDA